MLIKEPKSIADMTDALSALAYLAQNDYTDSDIDHATECIYEAFTMHECEQNGEMLCECDTDGIPSEMMRNMLALLEHFDTAH